MRRRASRIVSLILVLSSAFLFYSNVAYAQDISAAPDKDSITITNNAGVSDTVEVTGLAPGDLVKVYNAASGGSVLGSTTYSSYYAQATVTIRQLGTNAGIAYVSVTNRGAVESTRTPVNYLAEPVSTAPDADDITVTNNAGTQDTIDITNLSAYDAVKVYNQAKGGRVLGAASVSSNGTDVTVKVSQIGAAKGTLYVSVTSKYMQESSRTPVDFDAEPKTDPIDAGSVTITNNAKIADTVDVTDLNPGDTVRVYSKSQGGKSLGTATASSSKSEVIVSIPQLGTAAGTVYVTVTSKGETESDRTPVVFLAEPQSDAPSSGDVSITNNPAGTPDAVDITNCSGNDVVKIYNALAGGKLLGSATVPASKSDATVKINQIGSDAGSVYVTVTSKGETESIRTKCDYIAEVSSDAPQADEITVTNNAGSVDTVEVDGLSVGDKVKVYSATKSGDVYKLGKLLGSGSVSSGNTTATVPVSQLGTASGCVYVSVTSTGAVESSKTMLTYAAEQQSDAIKSSDVTITNSPAKTPDTIEVSGLGDGDTIKVYNAAKAGKLLGTAKVASGNTDTTLSISQLGTVEGYVYISVTSAGQLESNRVQVKYPGEPKSDAPAADDITVNNNPSGTSDTIQVVNLSNGDSVKVYKDSSGTKLLGTAIVTANGTSVMITVSQLGAAGGDIYVSVTSTGEAESDRIKVTFPAEGKSDVPAAMKVRVTNNANIADNVTVTGLYSGVVVNVYDALKGGKLLGTATVQNGNSGVSITIPQLNSAGGNVYVAVVIPGKLESDRKTVIYDAEGKSDQMSADNITVTNNAGIADTVVVDSLSPNDIIKVYDSADGIDPIGTATVPASGSQVTVSIPQLGTGHGTVYVTVTSKGSKQESDRVPKDYGDEPKSDAPAASKVKVANNTGVACTVTVSGLREKDVVNVYDASVRGNLLGTATVSQYGTQAVVTVSQLAANGSSIYVSVTSYGKQESSRTPVDYSGKPVSDAPAAQNTTVQNNVGVADTVTVKNLLAGDVVNVYDADTGSNLLGTATVQANSSQAIVNVQRLSAAQEYVYVSVMSTGKSESTRTKVTCPAESASNAPAAGNITVVNNAGMSGTVKITGLLVNDVVNVYDADNGGNLLGTGTMQSGTSKLIITLPPLGASGGHLYISVTSTGKGESTRTPVTYSAVSTAPDDRKVEITNNAGMDDTITVWDLTSNDVVKVYDSETGGTLLGSGTVSANSDRVTISVDQLTTYSGSVYISVTSFGKSESERTEATYTSEGVSTAPYIGNVTPINNVGIDDTVTVKGLAPSDVIKVYSASSSGTLLGYATVLAGSTQATVSVNQMGASGGTIYVSKISPGKTESSRIPVGFPAEGKSSRPLEVNIDFTYSASTSTPDTITIGGLSPYDMVKVYDASTGGSLLGSGSVSANGTQANVSIRLNTSGGTVYISVISTGKSESDRTTASYVGVNSR